MVFNYINADYNQLLSMSKRSTLLVVRLRTSLIEKFKCIRELNAKFMNMLFTLNNKPYDTRSGPLNKCDPMWSTYELLIPCVYGNVEAIWSYLHIIHKDTISCLGLSQKAVIWFIHQRFPHFIISPKHCIFPSLFHLTQHCISHIS